MKRITRRGRKVDMGHIVKSVIDSAVNLDADRIEITVGPDDSVTNAAPWDTKAASWVAVVDVVHV